MVFVILPVALLEHWKKWLMVTLEENEIYSTCSLMELPRKFGLFYHLRLAAAVLLLMNWLLERFFYFCFIPIQYVTCFWWTTVNNCCPWIYRLSYSYKTRLSSTKEIIRKGWSSGSFIRPTTTLHTWQKWGYINDFSRNWFHRLLLGNGLRT